MESCCFFFLLLSSCWTCMLCTAKSESKNECEGVLGQMSAPHAVPELFSTTLNTCRILCGHTCCRRCHRTPLHHAIIRSVFGEDIRPRVCAVLCANARGCEYTHIPPVRPHEIWSRESPCSFSSACMPLQILRPYECNNMYNKIYRYAQCI